MPTYEYACSRCPYVEEKRLSIGLRNALFLCPKCDGLMGLKISAPAVILKGDGWPGKEIKRKK